MFAKTLVLALILAGASLAFVADASAQQVGGQQAAPGRQAGGWQVDTTPKERHDPTLSN